jgi:hypothetical protein
VTGRAASRTESRASVGTAVAMAGFFGAACGVALSLADQALPGALLLGTVGALAWIGLSYRRPVTAFGALVLLWVLAYARLSTRVAEVAGPSTTNRGGLALGDVLWAAFVVAILLRPSTWRFDFGRLRQRYVWAMAPYLLGAVMLPFLGVVTGGWPISFASPGVRFAQWVSFLPIAFLLAGEAGAVPVIRTLFRALVAAGLLHAVYGLIQLGVQLGMLPALLVRLDDVYAAQNSVSWFFFARVTGFLVNPNHYGLFGALLMVAGVSWILASPEQDRGASRVAVAAALVPLALTGSRSAVAAIAGVTGFWVLLALTGHKLAARMLRMLPAAGALGAILAFAVWGFLPQVLQNRYRRLIAVFLHGTGAEQNLTARFGFWKDAWDAYWHEYPQGTWVAPSHVLHSAIDSYYVFTAVQGSPAFTLAWVVAMTAIFLLGLTAYRRAGTAVHGAGGLILAGWSIALLISSLTMSPLLQIQLGIPFWSLTGALLALRAAGWSPVGGTAAGGGAAPGGAVPPGSYDPWPS